MSKSTLRAFLDRLLAQVARLTARIQQLNAALAERDQSIAELEKRVTELETQLKIDSQSSSLPPSKDLKRSTSKPSTSLRESTGRKPGGQPGHPGAKLKMVETPDLVQTLRPQACGDCGASLAEALALPRVLRHQQFEIPPVKLQVTEYQRLSCT